MAFAALALAVFGAIDCIPKIPPPKNTIPDNTKKSKNTGWHPQCKTTAIPPPD